MIVWISLFRDLSTLHVIIVCSNLGNKVNVKRCIWKLSFIKDFNLYQSWFMRCNNYNMIICQLLSIRKILQINNSVDLRIRWKSYIWFFKISSIRQYLNFFLKLIKAIELSLFIFFLITLYMVTRVMTKQSFKLDFKKWLAWCTKSYHSSNDVIQVAYLQLKHDSPNLQSRSGSLVCHILVD